MTPSTVQFIEINVYEGMTPLASGYLQSYACRDEQLAAAYRFDHFVECRKTPVPQMLAALEKTNADVYALSCYVWNIGIMRTLLSALLAAKPDALFVVGGPQVMHHAAEYLDPANDRVLLCNGEGERTFSGVLRELLEDEPDFARVKGLSFARDGSIVSTEPQERISDLNEIPSPFLTGVFGSGYRMSVIETNRGCPFRCGFCYWGAANNDRVYKFDQERIAEEITWLAKNEIPVLHIADANWGMLKRDIELSQHIADCKAEYFFPFAVVFAAAKNSPQRVSEVTRIFTEAGLVNTQPISMQSLDETALDMIDRKNIRLGVYSELQDDLNDRGIGSYIELIWPLPGETLSSFKAGIEKLCERKAASIIVYAHLLLHNTPIFRNRDELGLVTRRGYDPAAEAEIIVGTAEVDYDDFKAGMWFIYAVNALYNTHAMRSLGGYLHDEGIVGFAELLDGFIAFAQSEPDHPFTRFCNESIQEARYYDFVNYPTVYHMVLHGERESFASLWARYCAAQPWWEDDDARAMFELDLIRKPFLYRDTPSHERSYRFDQLQIDEWLGRGAVVTFPRRHGELAAKHAAGAPMSGGDGQPMVYRIEHPRSPYPFNPDKREEDIADYCSGLITRAMSILPKWSPASHAL